MCSVFFSNELIDLFRGVGSLGFVLGVLGFSNSNIPRNRLSGFTTQQLAEKATKAGASGVDGMARAGKSGKHRGNISRDLLRDMLKTCSLPLLYWALMVIFL